ncbi:rhomboid family intramembrane serine protease [Streptomyces hiroshimensis]|uniref:rhomboid family intramembrane serine protease n=1 Tax=Streptomyces hiroshimensis TaxID=66424 RepID=UPI001E3359B3|nr:rhomboid family intramembrane serine protease [Streptomyces hiroshimensis]
MNAGQILAEARKALFVMVGFVALVWAVQLANWSGDYALSRHHGILPGDIGTLPDVFAASLLHWNWAHIESNSGPLFVFGFLAAYRGVARFLGLSVLVMVTSGLAEWVFGDGGTRTVGASGLVYGFFAYVVVRGLFDRHLIDTLIGVVMAASYAYILTTAVPGTPGISWLCHLGGLVGGVAGAWLFRDRNGARGRGRDGDGDRDRDGNGKPAPRPGLPARTADHPRAALHKELDDLGLL